MDVYSQLGQQAIFSIGANLFFIGISFYALQSLRLDQLFKKGMTFQIQLVYILLAITIGATVANFLVDFTEWSKQLQYLF